MKFLPRKRSTAVVAIGGGVALTATAAVAAILILGTGTLSATGATNPTITVNTTTISGKVVPGGPKRTITAKVTNPNDFGVKLDTATVSGVQVNAPSGVSVADCNSFVFHGTGSPDGKTFTLPANAFKAEAANAGNNSDEVTLTLPNAISQAESDTKSCDFTLTLEVAASASGS
jgi:hypothetical protein